MKRTIHILFLLMMSQSWTLANFGVYGSIEGKSVKPYFLYQNNDQDTSKINSSQVFFGGPLFKKHYELHGRKAVIDELKRKTWIDETVDSLMNKNEDDFPKLVMNELIHEDFYKASYRLLEKGVINFKDGGYLKLMSTSAHSIAAIGDITLAVNEIGEVFVNLGHICGGIIHFETHDKGKTQAALDFLNSFRSDTDDESWQSYIIDSKNKTNKQKF
ncbi:MAG TPA: hypothetical protein VK169_03380 [Saprospiraceae bacterium]|nr:hypothetical protein [Saprospiraceae bacterium]